MVGPGNMLSEAEMRIDVNNFYSGTYPLSAGASGPITGQTLAAGTTLSTNCIDHNPAQTPFGKNQNVYAGLGEPQAVLLQITAAPGDTSSSASYTVNLVTDTVSALNSAALTTLASLTVPKTAVVGSTYVLVIPPSLNFLRFSGLQYVLANGSGTASLGVFATLLPVRGLEEWAPYQSGWVIQNQ
jgi:hypothetical protein